MSLSPLAGVCLRRAAAFLLLVSIFSNSSFAAPEALLAAYNIAGNFKETVEHSYETGAIANLFYFDTIRNWLAKLGHKQQTLDRIEIRPSDGNGGLTLVQGDQIVLTAVAYSGEDMVDGVAFKWTAQDSTHPEKFFSLFGDSFKATKPGNFTVTATAETEQRTTLTVTVKKNEAYGLHLLLQKNDADRSTAEKDAIAQLTAKGILVSREFNSRTVYDPALEKALASADRAKLEAAKAYQRSHSEQQVSKVTVRSKMRRHGGPSVEDDDSTIENLPAVASVKRAMRPIDEDGWGGANSSYADDTANAVGHVNGEAPDAGVGTGDYSFAAPILNLPGRGINVNLALYYNSRLWSKAGTLMTYDPDKGYPAPGWNLGFGKMMYMGGTSGCMVVAEDGTRRSFGGVPHVTSYSGFYGVDHTGYTTDGSFIDYTCTYMSTSGGDSLTGSATLPNGTTISYGAPDSAYDQVYPTEILDAQGNYITISYVNNQGPNIDIITDTLGRKVNFVYDSNGLLTAIKYATGTHAPPNSEIRLHYTQPTLSYAFSSVYTTDTATNTPYLIDGLYYPATNNGYWFGDSDSYSSYGMIAKIIQQRGMSCTSCSTSAQGTINQGTMTDQRTYNFTLMASGSLTDAPTYSTMTEDWEGKDTSTAVTTYSDTKTSTDETITVTLPDGTFNKQVSHIDPGNPNDGMYYQGEIYTSSTATTPLSKTKTFLGSGDYATARPTRVEVTDELGQTTATDFSYATGKHNSVITQKQYAYGGTTLYRQINTTYNTATIYTTRHIFNLVASSETVDASGNRLNRTEYQYDSGTPEDAPGVVMHIDTYDPYTTDTKEINVACLVWDPPDGTGTSNCREEGEPIIIWVGDFEEFATCSCQEWETETVSVYDWTTAFRGNVTQTTVYADASPSTPTGGISYDYTYDETGNQKTATTNCCQQMSFDYADNYSDGIDHYTYAFPTSHTKGSAVVTSPLRMTETATYDYRASQIATSTDFNGLTTSMTYDAAYRPTLVTAPTGAKTSITYDDANLGVTQTVKLSDNTTIVSNSVTTTNGRGQPVLSKYQAGATNFNASQTKYDILGRRWKTSMPYDSASSPSDWTEFTYDNLSRLTQTTAPDGSTSKTFYNETSRPDSASTTAGQTVRSQDAWGRERWARTDDFGRLVEVVEPNPSGNGLMSTTGSLKTAYSYDQLDQLTTVTQGSQTRSFKYDSLGRPTRQKLAEQTATINDAGTYVGAGGTGANWSDAFTYDNRSNITQRVDARGVKSNFSYLISGSVDPLNRLQGISYDTSTADTTYTIDAAPAVSLSYMTTGDQTRVSSVATSGVATETNSYDSQSRISDYTLTLASRTSYPMQTSYAYDTANRLTQVTYPAQYGITGSPRKEVNPYYDQASRLTEMDINGFIGLNSISYNSFGQVTSLMTAFDYSYPETEEYTYDSQTGLLTNQKVRDYSSAIKLDLSYVYSKGSSVGTGTGKTGQLTGLTNNLDGNKDRSYEFDGLGRLTAAKGGTAAGATSVTANWSQGYLYDRYGNKTAVSATGITADSNAVPSDGLSSLAYNAASNRINTSGYQYDNAGNLIRGQNVNGVWQKFEYDAAGRLVKVMDDSSNVIEAYTYGADRSRLICETGSGRTYYAWGGSAPITEYYETGSSTTPTFSKDYVYAGSRLLSTDTNTGSGITTEFHHPDPLGTKLVTNPALGTSYEQSTLPFGTALDAESTAYTNQVFTSYDRSSSTGLDYAVNRTHSSGQGRFTQVDPIGMGGGSIAEPQSNNLYSYVNNSPIDFVDPSGLEPCDPAYGWDICGPGFWGYGGASGLLDISTRYSGTERDGVISQYLYFTPDFGGFSGGLGGGLGDDCGDSGIEIIIWDPVRDRPSTSVLGHGSAIIDGRSYSREAWGFKNQDPDEYIAERSKISGGIGYILDFGSKDTNDKFKTAYKSAHDYSIIYNPSDTCATAFVVAMNKIVDDLRKAGDSKLKSPVNWVMPQTPGGNKEYIENNLKQYTKCGKIYTKTQ